MTEPIPARRFRPRLLEAWAWLALHATLAVAALFVGVFGWPPAGQAGAAFGLFALIASVGSFPSAVLLFFLLAVRVDETGIRAASLCGGRRSLAFAEVAAVRRANLCGLRFWRLLRRQGGRPLWVPAFVSRRAELLAEIRERAGLETKDTAGGSPGPSLAASLVLSAALALPLAGTIWALRSQLHGAVKPRPAALEAARPVVTLPGLRATPVFEDASLGELGDLRVLDGPGPEALLLVGASGAIFLDAALRPLRTVRFEQPLHRPRAVPLGAEGDFAFLGRGSWCCRVRLLDASGAELWSYGAEVGVDDAAAGDLDGDGALDVVVGFNGAGGVHLLDAAGRRRWRELDGNVWRVALLDLDGDAHPEIVHSNASGQMVVRGPDGRVLAATDPPGYFSHFSALQRPGTAPALVHAVDEAIWMLGAEGTGERLPAPLTGDLGEPAATWLRLAPGEEPHLAVAVDFRTWDRSILYVYDAARRLVHQEILDGRTLALGARPRSDAPGSDDLLLLRPARLERWRGAQPAGEEPSVLEVDRRR